jgi:hypothetical protein
LHGVCNEARQARRQLQGLFKDLRGEALLTKLDVFRARGEKSLIGCLTGLFLVPGHKMLRLDRLVALSRSKNTRGRLTIFFQEFMTKTRSDASCACGSQPSRRDLTSGTWSVYIKDLDTIILGGESNLLSIGLLGQAFEEVVLRNCRVFWLSRRAFIGFVFLVGIDVFT